MIMDKFAEEYAILIEICIDDSNNNQSPKIAANYDKHEAERINPLNQ